MRERLGFLDGIKAVAAVLVFNIHFFNAYYCGVYTLDPASFHTKNGLEWWIGATPLNIIYAGKVGARLFLAVSAFLLVWSFRQRDGDKQNKSIKKLLWMPVKKYMRLVVPIVVVNLLICLLMRAGAYQNGAASALAGSWETFGVYNQFEPDFWKAFTEGAFGCFFLGTNRYNGPLWFIQYEFLGCMFIAAVLLVTRKWKYWWRFLAYGFLAFWFIRTDYLCMILAAAAAELYVMDGENEKKQYTGLGMMESWCGKLLQNSSFMWILFAMSLFFLTYPSFGKVEGTMYEWLPPKVLFYYNAALPVFLLSVMYLKPVQSFFNRRFLAKFSRISYCFYLVHFPVLCTVSAAFFAAMYGRLPYNVLAFLTYLLSFFVSGLTAWCLYRCVDKPMQRFTGKMMERLER
ncbi:MAG: acyltransferase [Clostridiales bacterium]|nr:acyltransferase [Clostridiales bacterium]